MNNQDNQLMITRYPIIKLIFLLILIEVGLFYVYQVYPNAGDENGLFENLSVFFIGLGFIASSYKFFVYSKLDHSVLKIISFGFAVLSLSFMIREMDVRGVAGLEWLALLTSDEGEKLLTLALWVPFFIYCAKHFANTKLAIQQYWIGTGFKFMSLVLGFLVFANLVEVSIIPLSPKLFYEESFELLAWVVYAYTLFRLSEKHLRQLN